MTFPTRLRKLILTTHICFSVGWLGAVAVFLIHAITGLTSTDATMIRSVYIAMKVSAWAIILPCSFGALITGVIQAICTPWGLFKHYWIAVKLLLTVGATILLLIHMQSIDKLAQVVSQPSFSIRDYKALQIQLIVDSALAIIVLLGTTAISVYKPWGLTNYGKSVMNRKFKTIDGKKRSMGYYFIIAIIILLVFVLLKHLVGGGMNH